MNQRQSRVGLAKKGSGIHNNASLARSGLVIISMAVTQSLLMCPTLDNTEVLQVVWVQNG